MLGRVVPASQRSLRFGCHFEEDPLAENETTAQFEEYCRKRKVDRQEYKVPHLFGSVGSRRGPEEVVGADGTADKSGRGQERILTWVKLILVGFRPFEHEGAVHQVAAQGSNLPCLVRCARHATLPTAFQIISPKCLPPWRLAPLCTKQSIRQNNRGKELQLRPFPVVMSWLCFSWNSPWRGW